MLQNHGGKSTDTTFDKHSEHHPQVKDQLAQEKQTLLMAMQPSESEFSFELCLDSKRQPQTQHTHRMQTAGVSQVHRSISQPECTNTAAEKNLLRYFSMI